MTAGVTGTLGERTLWIAVSPNQDSRKTRAGSSGPKACICTQTDGHALIEAQDRVFCVAAGMPPPEMRRRRVPSAQTLDYAGSFQRGHPKAFRAGRPPHRRVHAGRRQAVFL